MNEAQLFEALGRKQVRLEQLDAAYSELLQALARVVSGEVSTCRILVNLTDRSWQQTPPGVRPGLPSTINGVPVCVVAPVPCVDVPVELAPAADQV